MNSNKRKRSNEQRLKAVEEKKARLKSHQLTIKVSNGVTNSNHHMVFTSDSEESSREDGQKLELFRNENSDGSDSEGEQRNWGDKFEGNRGAQLFQLQHKIGHDVRFRVDKRFLEDEDENMSEDEGDSGRETEDDIGEQVQREKANALRIINSLFGGDYDQLSGGQKPITANYTHVLPLRYDPNSDTCAELELGHTPDGSPPQDACSPVREDLDSPNTSSPTHPDMVSTDKYYNVSEDIKDLFSSSNEQFSFLTEMTRDSDNDDSSMVDDMSPLATAGSSIQPKWIKNINKLSSSSEDEPESAKVTSDQELASADTAAINCLFFHSSIPRLRNRLDENSFYRSQPLSELESSWPQRRTAMKQSFRKRRKDAMKMAKKKLRQNISS